MSKLIKNLPSIVLLTVLVVSAVGSTAFAAKSAITDKSQGMCHGAPPA